jgi:hypothetical protein
MTKSSRGAPWTPKTASAQIDVLHSHISSASSALEGHARIARDNIHELETGSAGARGIDLMTLVGAHEEITFLDIAREPTARTSCPIRIESELTLYNEGATRHPVLTGYDRLGSAELGLG